MAKVDVLLPVKNGIAFLAESIESVKAQTFKDWRLLVLDHGSTDGSRELADEYSRLDSRIVLYSCEKADGLAGLLNLGLDMADCEFAMRHDADDVCFPDRMEKTLAAFASEPNCIVVGGQAELMDANGRTTGLMKMPVGRQRIAAASLFTNPVAHPTAMLRMKEVAKRNIRYGIDVLKVLPLEQRMEVTALAEDYFLFGQLGIVGACSNVPHKLIRYRRHGNSVGATRGRQQLALSLAISRSLADSFAALHALPRFDPAPFCNHGGQLFDIADATDFSDAFLAMEATLYRGFGRSPGLDRELFFRRVLATRHDVPMLWRYAHFALNNVADTGEWNAVRSWLLRRLGGRHVASVAPVCQT